MKNSFSCLFNLISYLEITALASIALIVSVEAVMAEPLCYLIDANGNRINLSYLCQSKKQKQATAPAPQNTPVEETTNQTSPTENQTGTTTNTNNNTTTENQEPNPSEETVNPIDNAIRRKIPLMNNQF